jgi:ABC-type transport system involved in multi-copper enzyme maturation permease subunit
MIRAILWKEYREQRLAWIVLSLFGGLALVGLLSSSSPFRNQTDRWVAVYLVAAFLVWTQGMVSGAMLLAGEREAGTGPFLESLPGSRLTVWLGKFLAGALLVQAQILLFLVVGAVLRYQDNIPIDPWREGAAALTLPFAGLLGYAWGLLFSAWLQNVLYAILLACLTQFFSLGFVSALGAFLAALLAQLIGRTPWAPLLGVGCALLATSLLALFLSARVFAHTDFQRRQRARHFRDLSELPLSQVRAMLTGWISAAWLGWRQIRFLSVVLLPCAALLGLAVIPFPLFVWPGISLLLGVLCGASTFADEQEQGSFRFLGNQRFPAGVLWVTKVGFRLGLVLVATSLALFPGVVVLVVRALTASPDARSPLFAGSLLTRFLSWGPMVLLWPLYGFSIGQLCGLLFRRPLVAGVVSLGLSGLLVVLWIPSIINGGLHLWQILGIPILLLLATRLLFPLWVSSRLYSRSAVGLLFGCAGACLLWQVSGLWYRVVEIPAVPEDRGFTHFIESLPPPEENQAGSLIRSASAELESLSRNKPALPGQPGGAVGPRPPSLEELVARVAEHGWTAPDPRLEGWLDELFAGGWDEKLAEAAALPTGVVEDPRRLTFASALPALEECRFAANLLVARGLQQQARGKPEVFVDHLRSGLAVARNLQNGAPLFSAYTGRNIEARVLHGARLWLEKAKRPDLLRRVLDILLDHESKLPDPVRCRYAEHLMARNSLDDPSILGSRPSWETSLFALAWQVPWEAERNRRLLQGYYSDDPEIMHRVRQFRTVIFLYASPPRQPYFDDPSVLARLRGGQLVVALRLYEVEQHQPARQLDQLLAKGYLKALPVDPFSGRDFGYRLSTGKAIPWHRRGTGNLNPEMRVLPKGQGILWSVGPDRTDNLGRSVSSPGEKIPGTDWIFLVPSAKEKKE